MSITFKKEFISRFASLIYCISAILVVSEAYSQDSLSLMPDSSQTMQVVADTTADSSLITANHAAKAQKDCLLSNRFISHLKPPAVRSLQIRNMRHPESEFYFLLLLLLILGITKNYFHRYFSNMFRVFFNTSLRQNQLTEQLLQSRVPSFLFNLLYFLSAGFFIFRLLGNRGVVPEKDLYPLFWIIATLTFLYLVKYCWLKFLGWLSGSGKAFSGYTFIIFLSAKIMGVLLLLLLPVITLSEPWLSEPFTWLALALMLFLLLIRYFKAYNVLSDKVSLSGFHFMIFLLTLELLPLAILWHAAEKYIFKIS
jgi:hypothetical protein